MSTKKSTQFPPQQQQTQPGKEHQMTPPPDIFLDEYKPGGNLQGKVAIITGGDSGIGRATAVLFSKEGANVAIAYLDEHTDAQETKKMVEREGQQCILLAGDVGSEAFCTEIVETVMKKWGNIDCLINNAAEQHPQSSLEDISAQQLERTFRTNIYSYFYLTKAALPHLKAGSSIINTTSVTAYRGSSHLIDYASTKGAIVGFTRSLALNLASKQIRVNAVAPGPIWTPLIPASFSAEKVANFGADVPLGRAGQPSEVAPCFVFLAAEMSRYMTGQVLHPNGGEIING